MITLPTDVFPANAEVIVDYSPKFNKYTQLDNESTKFASSGKVVIDAWFTDICTNEDVPLQVVLPKGKISGEVDISFGDQAATHNIAVEAMASACETSTKLWSMYAYEEEEIVD